MIKSLQHLNGNVLCAVDTETTGLKPGYHEIHQVAILPLDHGITPCKTVRPFCLDIKINFPERIDTKAIKTSKLDFAQRQLRAIEAFTAADLLDEWFDRLGLAIYKRICPLAHNWPFDREHLTHWLGNSSFEHIFSPLYRDTLPITIMDSDRCGFRGEKVCFVQHNLAYLCGKLSIKNQKAHDALQDCIATAELYRRYLSRY